MSAPLGAASSMRTIPDDDILKQNKICIYLQVQFLDEYKYVVTKKRVYDQSLLQLT